MIFLAPRSQRAAAKAAAKPSHAGETNTAKFPRVTVEHVHADVSQDLDDLLFLIRLEVMIAEHADHRDLDRREIPRQNARLFGQAVVRQITAQHENVRALGDLREQWLQRTLRCL